MRNEEKLFSIKCELEDRDFDEVYRIYLAAEHKERYIPVIICAVLAVVFVILAFTLKNITMVFYAVACVLVGLSYRMIPTNKKFLATNRLQYGEIREMDFYPHEVTTFEWLEDEEEITEEERESGTASFSTGSLKAYENKQGILLAEGTIVNNFLYIPKRALEDETLAMLIDFAKNSCSGGYELLEMQSLLGGDVDLTETEGDGEDAEDLCERYYGMDQIRVVDENGNRIREDEDEAYDEDADDSDEETLDFSEISEDEDSEESDTLDFTEVPEEEEDADESEQ